jgi:acyl carrier protein
MPMAVLSLFVNDIVRYIAMTHADVLSSVQTCIAETLRIDPGLVSPDAVVIDLGAESLDLVEMVFRLERLYTIKLPRRYSTPDAFTVDAYAAAIEAALAEGI